MGHFDRILRGGLAAYRYPMQRERIFLAGAQKQQIDCVSARQKFDHLFLDVCVQRRGPLSLIEGPSGVATFVQKLIGDQAHESLLVCYMNASHCVMGVREWPGGLNTAVFDVRDAIRSALLIGAPAIILAHNHPGSTLNASRDDIELTKQFITYCKAVGITLLDHVIVTSDGRMSFAEEGILNA